MSDCFTVCQGGRESLSVFAYIVTHLLFSNYKSFIFLVTPVQFVKVCNLPRLQQHTQHTSFAFLWAILATNHTHTSRDKPGARQGGQTEIFGLVQQAFKDTIDQVADASAAAMLSMASLESRNAICVWSPIHFCVLYKCRVYTSICTSQVGM